MSDLFGESNFLHDSSCTIIQIAQHKVPGGGSVVSSLVSTCLSFCLFLCQPYSLYLSLLASLSSFLSLYFPLSSYLSKAVAAVASSLVSTCLSLSAFLSQPFSLSLLASLSAFLRAGQCERTTAKGAAPAHEHNVPVDPRRVVPHVQGNQ